MHLDYAVCVMILYECQTSMSNMALNIPINMRHLDVNIFVNNLYLIGCINKYCILCYNATSCYECVPGYFLEPDGECIGKCSYTQKPILSCCSL